MQTELPEKRQGPALVLSREEEAQEVVLEYPENHIASENGVDVIISRLNRLHKKNLIVTKHQVLEVFETFQRICDMPIQAFLNKFK